MATNIDYLHHLASESDRFFTAVAAAPPDAAVPSCPEWNTEDLLWHLAEVQWFWATIVAERLSDPSALQHPDRPPDPDGLRQFFTAASDQLRRVLAGTAAETEVWTWSDDHSVGFIRRRQAHEALIHRVDAELTAGERTPLDAVLAADGVDEALRVMYGGWPSWGAFTAEDGKTVRFRAIDTGDSWLVRLGRFTGTDPEGPEYDERGLDPDDKDAGSEAAASIEGRAADLDCWLWRRPTDEQVRRTGDQEVLTELDEILASGIN